MDNDMKRQNQNLSWKTGDVDDNRQHDSEKRQQWGVANGSLQRYGPWYAKSGVGVDWLRRARMLRVFED